jgi:alanyl-tRNA synthetase
VVEPLRLRFDFSHYTAMDAAEIAEVERLANEQVWRNAPVETSLMELDQALTTGAMALFGEKYGDRVRVVSVPGFSRELCGGTHVSRTGDIGLVKIVYESSIAAGVRRLEAVTGEGALRRFQETQGALAGLAGLVRAPEPELLEHVEKLLEQRRTLEKELEQLKNRLAQSQVEELHARRRQIGELWVLAQAVDAMERGQLRGLADSLRNKGTDVVVLATSAAEVAIVAAVRKAVAGKVHAGRLAALVAQAVGGKGGGRPDMAEGGGKESARLSQALEQVYRAVAELA